MLRQDDVILEGVRAAELASLSALARGEPTGRHTEMAPLYAKGWVELVGNEPVITLTGRALLERPPAGLL
jgi:hypothetical protein